MAVDTIAGLKAKMPQSVAAGVTVSDLWDLIDTLEDRTTQSLITTAINYGVSPDENRRKIVVTAASDIIITLPSNTPVGFELVIVQMNTGAGVVAVTGGSILSKDNHTRTAGQYAVAFLFCASNSGTAPQIVLTGDTAP